MGQTEYGRVESSPLPMMSSTLHCTGPC